MVYFSLKLRNINLVPALQKDLYSKYNYFYNSKYQIIVMNAILFNVNVRLRYPFICRLIRHPMFVPLTQSIIVSKLSKQTYVQLHVALHYCKVSKYLHCTCHRKSAVDGLNL